MTPRMKQSRFPRRSFRPSPTSQVRPPLTPDASHGSIRLRRLGPADADHLDDLLERLSPRSRYLRYFRLLRSIPPADVARFVSATPGHLAVGAFDKGVLVGAAQYFRSSERPDHAEVSVEVADSHQRRRVGTRLVDELARLAVNAGITHFTATVLAENRAVLGLMRHSGWGVEATRDGIYTDIVLTLPQHLVGGRTTCGEPRDPGAHLPRTRDPDLCGVGADAG